MTIGTDKEVETRLARLYPLFTHREEANAIVCSLDGDCFDDRHGDNGIPFPPLAKVSFA
jgi:hypothetical protein